MRRLTVVLAVTAVLAAGCGGTTAQLGSGASSIVPASAPAFIAIDADPQSQQWQTIDSLASKFPDKQKAVDSIKQDMTSADVSWERDVKPVLQGELDVVWLDFKNNGRNVVALMQPKNEAKFKELIAKASKAEQDPSNRVVYEKFRGWYVLAPDRATIDRFEQESNAAATSLADDKSFKQSMARLGTESVMRAYVNGGLMKLAGSAPAVRKVGGTSVHAMASSGIGLYYADVDGKFVVTDQPQGIRSLKGSGTSLSDSAEFQQAKNASGMPDRTWSTLYVNIHAGVPYVEKLAQQHIPAEIARNIKPLRSAVEYAASHTHEIQVTFFLRIN